jgi:hypothetical protein
MLAMPRRMKFTRMRRPVRATSLRLVLALAWFALSGSLRAAGEVPVPEITFQGDSAPQSFSPASDAAATGTLPSPVLNAGGYATPPSPIDLQPTNFQTPFADDSGSASPFSNSNPGASQIPKPQPPPPDPCAAVMYKPLNQLGIDIAITSGDVPADQAAACAEQTNQYGAPLAFRCWGTFTYQWDATCLCYRPLYFEEINLERYGYECDCCLQPAASAAHFFATVPALPYCMAVDCPRACKYTLGHYRPGSCPPWRWHWPPCDLLAAAATGGVYTGLIFMIP